ncbi:PstS family phosphate ABC transporter substrate-binding protein [Oleiharenicola lentus]|uniref:PstS family phosphate ABC transporter substrate-binding protein n=1 Tax=Oleiharenicola lentus TaxID=2508720 RepID=UPI003F67305D
MRVFFAFAAAVIFAGSSFAALEVIRVSGSDLLGADFTKAVAEFARRNDVTVKLELHGTRPGVDELKARRADVGLFMFPPGEKPPAEALISKAVAYQVAVVLVPAASPLKQVTVAQLRGMFGLSAGEAFSRWGELNLTGEWASRPIVLRGLSPKAGLAFPLFQRVILGGGEPKVGLTFAATTAELNASLTSTVNAIMVSGLPASEVAGVRALAIAPDAGNLAHGPTAEAIHAGGYGLRMPIYVMFRRESAQDLQDFLKFLLSDEAAAALAKAHFASLPLSARNQLIFELEEIR